MLFIEKLHKVRNLGFRTVVWLTIDRLFLGPAFSIFERLGIHVLPVHYYSPVPDTRELRKDWDLWHREWSFVGVDFDLGAQVELLKGLQFYECDCDERPPYRQIDSMGLGLGYSEMNSRILHAMLRHLKPSSLIEVGSGVSTMYSLNSLNLNKKETSKDATMICVEPYPSPSLRTLTKEHGIELIPKRIQEIDSTFFQRLRRGDVLFIDSTHIVKLNSDVNYLYLEVLPNLNEGVVIAIDDIPFPFPSPDPEYWILKRHRFFTEPSLVHALLMFSNAFKILLCSSYLHHKAPEAMVSAFGIYDAKQGVPGSLWLQKVR
jgi:hypothetical protein